MSDIGLAALGAALAEADHKVRETGGNNRGPRIKEYLANCDPPLAEGAPWCAAFVQYCADIAARGTGMPNPLDAVRLEAFVQNYYDTLRADEVPAHKVLRGYLVLFSFGGQRWDHIGIVAQPPRVGQPNSIWSVEGNTSDSSQRDGDGVYLKPRLLNASYPVTFIKW